ncbi:hypothetical protein [Salinarimonas rosea]|uniref:hypothetical protein n=1 Tax=Salinarimonas rosea TaxID=552063 RepID=UPI00048C3C62
MVVVDDECVGVARRPMPVARAGRTRLEGARRMVIVVDPVVDVLDRLVLVLDLGRIVPRPDPRGDGHPTGRAERQEREGGVEAHSG